MKKNPGSTSGFVYTRNAVALLLCLFAVSLGLFSFDLDAGQRHRFARLNLGKQGAPTPDAPTPATGTLSTSSGPLTFTDNSPLAPNPTGEGVGFSKPTCTPNTCSTYSLKLDPSLFVAAGNYDPSKNNIIIQISWPTNQAQFGSFVEDKNGNVIASNTSGLDPITITIPIATANLQANGPFNIVTTAEIGTSPSLTGTISLVETSGAGQACNGCTAPRYQMYEAPSGTAARAGEPSIGVDWNPNLANLKQVTAGNAAHGPTKLNTGGITMFTATFDQYRVAFDDCSSPAANTWTDVAFAAQQTATLDAIGFTDHFTSAALGAGVYTPGNPATPGRTFHGQLTAGDSNTSFTDDDGETHTPSQGGGVPQGPDHETIGAGPYNPNSVPAPPPHPTYQNAVYYCTQNIAPEAECSRSDDGGVTFGPGVPIYNLTQCSGSIHGHIKVARDGTAYVPNYSCTIPGQGNQGVAVSTDNGISWTERNVPGSGSPKPGLVDPSVAIGLNDVGKPAQQASNTIYLGYIDNDGTPKVAASHDRGVNWSAPQNVGAAFGIVNSTFPVVIAGDDNRAAFGFLGTTTPGDSSLNANFPGVWHLYIATTYNAGASWITIDATPDDPIQVGPVCNGGTTCPTKRNLLDFNGFDVDSEGRGLLGLSDGCINCTNTSTPADSNAAQGLIARQSGGPRLFAFFDPPPQAAPAAPHVLSAVAQSAPGSGVLVSWLEPDNGGSPITAYKIYRGTTSGGEDLNNPIAVVTNDPLHKQTKYLDTTATGANNYFYHVTAVNAVGESAFCEEVSIVQLVATGNACTFPFVTVNGPGSKAAEANSAQTIQSVSIGEPFTSCTDNSLTFVIKVPTLDAGVIAGGPPTGQAAPPPNTEWQVLFNVDGKDANNNPVTHTVFVEMDTNCPIGNSKLPEFTYGRRDPGATGTFDQGECTAQPGNPAITCPALSGSYSADGTITIKLDLSQPLSFSANTGAADATEGAAFTWDGHLPKTKLSSVSSEITLFAGCGAGFLESLSSSSGTSYTRVGNLSCSTLIPVAQLSATPASGNAPLNVTFDAGGSHEPNGACGTINSYTMDFGDGSNPVTQDASHPSFMHTYSKPGTYPATLTVKDTAGQTSTNLAQQVITVTSAAAPQLSGVVSSKLHGPAGTFNINMPLTGNPGIECRSGGQNGNFTIVFTFANALMNVDQATVTHGAGSVTSGAIGQDPHQYIVTLTGVTNAQFLTVALVNAHDSTGKIGNVAATMGFLMGDVDGSGHVDAGDIGVVQRNNSKSASANPRADVDVSGHIDVGDIGIIQKHNSTGLH